MTTQARGKWSPVKKYLTVREVGERYGIHKATVWRWAAEGKLPRPVRISPTAARFVLAELEERDRKLERIEAFGAARSHLNGYAA